MKRRSSARTMFFMALAISGILFGMYFKDYKGDCVPNVISGVVADVSHTGESTMAGKFIEHRTFTTVKFNDGKAIVFTGHYNSLVIGKENEITYEFYPDTTADKNTGDILSVKILGYNQKRKW